MKKIFALLLVFICTVCSAKRNIQGSMSIPTNSDEERQTLAKQLVVMVFSGSQSSQLEWRGAAVLVGMDDECLYAATPDHLARGSSAGPLWVKHSWSSDQVIKTRLLSPHDAGLDVAVLCIPEPQRSLFPMPRIPFYLKGSVRELASGDNMVSIGHGGDVAWRVSTPMTFERADGDLLFVRGGGIQAGDSGAGLFNREAAFQELVGMVLRTSEGVTTAVSVEALSRLFGGWALPFNLQEWNFKEHDRLDAPMLRAVLSNVDWNAPPQRDGRPRVERLVVSVSGGPLGISTGLLLGAGNGEVLIGVPWAANEASGEPIIARFSNGLALPVTLPAPSSGLGLVLRAPISAADLTELLALVTGSPLQANYVSADRLSTGRSLYLAGIDRSGAREILPRDHAVTAVSANQLTLLAPAVSRAARGWTAFDDSNNVVGIVTAVTDKTVTVTLMNAWMSKVQTLDRLQPWEPMSAPLQMTVGGRQVLGSCTFPRLVRYGGSDDGQGLGRLGNSILFTGLATIDDQPDSYIASISTDGRVNFVNQADTAGRKYVNALAIDESRSLALTATTLNKNASVAGAEGLHCGVLEQTTAAGRTASKRLTCEAPIFLPSTIRRLSGQTFAAGSTLERQDAVVAASLAQIDNEGRPRVLAVDKEVNVFNSAAAAPGGDIYVIGDGANLTTSSQAVSVARYSSTGGLRWKRSDPIPQRQEDAEAIVVTGDGGLVVVGSLIRPSDRTSEVILWRYSSAGELVWKKTFGRVGLRLAAFDAVDDGQGGVVVAGLIDSLDPATPVIDAWLLDVDSQGQLRWQKSYSPRHVATRRVTYFKRILRDGDGFWTLANSSYNGELVGTILMRVKPNGDIDDSTCRR